MDLDELYEQVVKAQLYKTLFAYQDDDGTVDMAGWLADACMALGFDEPGRNWRRWADEVAPSNQPLVLSVD